MLSKSLSLRARPEFLRSQPRGRVTYSLWSSKLKLMAFERIGSYWKMVIQLARVFFTFPLSVVSRQLRTSSASTNLTAASFTSSSFVTIGFLSLMIRALDHYTVKALLAVFGTLYAELVISDPVSIVEKECPLSLFLHTHSRHIFYLHSSCEKSRQQKKHQESICKIFSYLHTNS